MVDGLLFMSPQIVCLFRFCLDSNAVFPNSFLDQFRLVVWASHSGVLHVFLNNCQIKLMYLD